jgi:AbiV family abortive infection protein
MKSSNKERLLKKAVQSCVNNVEQYFKDAHLLLENGSYGHAFAFTVLGEEELSKAYIYNECSEGFLPEDIVAKMGKGSRSHMRKQLLAATLVPSFGIVKFFQELADTCAEGAKGDRSKYFQALNRELKDKEKIEERFTRMMQLIKRMAASEEDKQNGLYVDVKLEEGVLKSPESLKKQTVEERLAQAEELFQFMRPFLMLTLTSSERQYVKAQLESSGVLKSTLEALDYDEKRRHRKSS